MYDGWMSYGGAEIFNGPRTKAYLQHLQPSLSLGDMCCECDTLAEALGDPPYSTPAQDYAGWFNEYATETAGFYGLIPLAVQGFEDSTWEIPLTELMGDGSVSGRGRLAGRDLRFKMLAVAESEKAMSRGLAWLRDTLGAENCGTGECGGAQICYLTDCPGCCSTDAPEAETTIDHLDYRKMTPTQAAQAARRDWESAQPVGAAKVAGITYATWPGVELKVERLITGFVPGQTYKISLDMGAPKPEYTIGVSVPGAAERLTPLAVDVAFAYAPNPDKGNGVWQFIATECEHRIVISSSEDLSLGMLDVTMINQTALVYTGQPGIYASHAQAWTAPWMGQSPYVVTQPKPGEWHFTAPASTTLPSGYGEVQMTLTSLTPGVKHRVTVLATTDDNVGAVPGTVYVTDETFNVLASAPLPTTPLAYGLHGGWVTMEFTPIGSIGKISVINTNPVLISPTNTLVVGVRTVLVEEIQPFVAEPDEQADIRRYLRDVVLTSGPQITQEYPSYTAVMKEVEWTMRANVPSPLGEELLVTQTLGAARWVVPEIGCSLGEAVRTNYVPNPSGEYGTASWFVNAGSTITNPTSGTPYSGTRVIRVTQNTANSVARAITVVPQFGVSPGVAWTFTTRVRTSKAGRNIRALFTWFQGSMVTGLDYADLKTSDSLTDWQPLVVSATAPPGTTSLALSIELSAPSGGFIANEWTEFDGLMLEQGVYGQRSYFDGDSLYGGWMGTKGNSPSGYTRTNPALVYDPECPPSPPAPRPPDIVNLCLTVPQKWLRYVLELPALASANAPRSAPTMTISTGQYPARGVRVRVYADPFNRGIEELDPCSFCGEFLISYMPPRAALTVDAVDRTATVVTPDGEQSALGLLFGSDGGPVVWPTIGCAVPYVFTVDVDADIAPLIAASLSVTPIF